MGQAQTHWAYIHFGLATQLFEQRWRELLRFFPPVMSMLVLAFGGNVGVLTVPSPWELACPKKARRETSA